MAKRPREPEQVKFIVNGTTLEHHLDTHFRNAELVVNRSTPFDPNQTVLEVMHGEEELARIPVLHDEGGDDPMFHINAIQVLKKFHKSKSVMQTILLALRAAHHA